MDKLLPRLVVIVLAWKPQRVLWQVNGKIHAMVLNRAFLRITPKLSLTFIASLIIFLLLIFRTHLMKGNV